MSKMNAEKKVVDRKVSLTRLRTLSAHALKEVVGGDEYLVYRFRDVTISH